MENWESEISMLICNIFSIRFFRGFTKSLY